MAKGRGPVAGECLAQLDAGSDCLGHFCVADSPGGAGARDAAAGRLVTHIVPVKALGHKATRRAIA